MTRRMKFDGNNLEHLHNGWRWETVRVPFLMALGRTGEAMDAEAAARSHWNRLQELSAGGQES